MGLDTCNPCNGRSPEAAKGPPAMVTASGACEGGVRNRAGEEGKVLQRQTQHLRVMSPEHHRKNCMAVVGAVVVLLVMESRDSRAMQERRHNLDRAGRHFSNYELF
ncbi:unnamed protein product [Lepidochelys olivacea]